MFLDALDGVGVCEPRPDRALLREDGVDILLLRRSVPIAELSVVLCLLLRGFAKTKQTCYRVKWF